MKLLVLDKDGTLTRTKSGHTFVQHPEDQVLIDGVAEAIAAYAADGWTMAIASNQGGVAAGHKTLEQAIAEMRYAMELTGITYSVFCPDKDGQEAYIVRPKDSPYSPQRMTSGHDECLGFNFRKPSNGMLQLAKKSFCGNSNLKKGLMIGDRDEDFGAAVNAGFGYMHVSAWLEPFVK